MNKLRNREHGAVLVETALSSVVFAMLLFAIFDFGRMFYFQSRLQHAVSQSTRFATTGNTLEDPNNPGTQMSRVDSIKAMIKQLSGIQGFGANDIQINTVMPDGTLVAGAGSPGDVVTVSATWRIPVVAPFLSAMFPGGEYQFTATTTFRNEEFPGNAFNRAPGLTVAVTTA